MEGITSEAATFSYLFLSGDETCKATDLAAFLPRWLSEVNENRLIPPGIPELLTHLLLPFGTRDILEHIAKLRIPDSLTDVQKWMVKLQVLVDNKAHERLLQKLESIPDQMISFEDICGQSNTRTNDNLAVDPRRNLRFDHDIRDVMIRGDKDEMRQYQDVFYGTGSVAWTVRSPYWNIALATDDEGIRLLPDNVLDRVLPKWRQILTGETIPTPKYGVIDSFRAWLASEEKKASDLGKPWPETPVIPVSSAPKPKFVSPKTPDRSRLRAMNSSRFSPFESSPNAPNNEQTELLRDILTELKDLKNMISQNIGRKQECEIAGNQPYGSWQQSFHPIPSMPQGMQPNYLVPQQSPFVGAQYLPPLPHPEWERWNSQYQGPATMPDPGPGSASHP
ncbi:hypothetical protein DTO013E5_5065 [Penicillium roqueforti]|nr:uncharacterized protein LCP9604111_5685 [Penicillium roqueforti]KAF9247976.1 hypothetical protein LCP9604111_5685 [Penicillium roqueforti]KAI2714899.1 hypothetical protein CBS147318_6476 [Penicillium roqueforti]KAI2742942.1 hypothetical protein DTO012A1_3604 [Penicillium roqueforti]KAI2755548.1 hypothetical protein DTO013F2_1231 [Penicillium roqueforti]KAI2769792.1 hypothetical protein DTO012A8_5300 [Penicillium roqueforti]